MRALPTDPTHPRTCSLMMGKPTPVPCVPVASAPARLCRFSTPVFFSASGGSCAASLDRCVGRYEMV